MSDDLCQMALRQTLELVSLTDEKLRGLARRKFSPEETYREVLVKVLGGGGSGDVVKILRFYGA